MPTERKVSTEEGAALAKKYGIKFLETSAKNSTNVIDAFKAMTAEMHTRIMKKKPTSAGPTPSGSHTDKSREGKKVVLSKEASEGENKSARK